MCPVEPAADIRHILIGNEGALAYITEVTVKLFAFYPDHNHFLGWRLGEMKPGFEILQDVMAAGYSPRSPVCTTPRTVPSTASTRSPLISAC